MSDNPLHNQLSSLSRTHTELPLHQQKRRQQLLELHASRKQASQKSLLGTFVTILQEGVHVMRKSNTLAITSVFATIAVVVGIMAVTLSSPAPVSAAEQLKKTNAAVSQMTEEQKAALNKKFQDDLQKRLQEAKSASDLRYISAEEFKQLTNMDPAVKLRDLNVKSYLSYTSPQGQKVVMVVDKDDQPIVVLGTGKDVMTLSPMNKEQ